MSFKVGISVEDNVKSGFSRLENRRIGAILRGAATAAGTPVLQDARRRVPVDTKQLKRALQKKVKSFPGSSVAVVGPAKGFRGEFLSPKSKRRVLRNPQKYAHLVEKGHKIAGTKGGFVEGRPFIEPAYQSTKAQAENIVRHKIEEGIAKALS